VHNSSINQIEYIAKACALLPLCIRIACRGPAVHRIAEDGVKGHRADHARIIDLIAERVETDEGARAEILIADRYRKGEGLALAVPIAFRD
jgi:hypothetical protein